MAPLGFLNEDVTTAGSTKDIIVYYNPDLFSIKKMMDVKTIENESLQLVGGWNGRSSRAAASKM